MTLLTAGPGMGFSQSPGIVFKPGQYGNSGFQAMNLAHLLGADRILLLGFDMTGSHFFGKHSGALKQSDPTRFYKGFAQSAPLIAEMGVEVVNCTRTTILDMFPRRSVDSAWHPH